MAIIAPQPTPTYIPPVPANIRPNAPISPVTVAPNPTDYRYQPRPTQTTPIPVPIPPPTQALASRPPVYVPPKAPLVTTTPSIQRRPAKKSSVIPSLNLADNPLLQKTWELYALATVLTSASLIFSRKDQVTGRVPAHIGREKLARQLKTTSSKAGKWALGLSLLAIVPFLVADKWYGKATKAMEKTQSKADWKTSGKQQMLVGGLAALPFIIDQGWQIAARVKPALQKRLPLLMFGTGALAVLVDTLGTLGCIVGYNGWRDWRKGN